MSDWKSELVMSSQRESGQTDPHELIVRPTLIDKVQGNHRSVIEPFITLAQSAGIKLGFGSGPAQFKDEFRIIGNLHFHLRRPKTGKISDCTVSGRNMKIVLI